jgi:hypothetical protein
VCGVEPETSYHATVTCTKARALRNEMRKIWDLPSEEVFRYTGPDWLPLLLGNITKERRSLVLLVLWRSWHLRNDIVHAKGDARIDQSVNFLNRYINELGYTYINPGNAKGKIEYLNSGCSLDCFLSHDYQIAAKNKVPSLDSTGKGLD